MQMHRADLHVDVESELKEHEHRAQRNRERAVRRRREADREDRDRQHQRAEKAFAERSEGRHGRTKGQLRARIGTSRSTDFLRKTDAGGRLPVELSVCGMATGLYRAVPAAPEC